LLIDCIGNPAMDCSLFALHFACCILFADFVCADSCDE
jgi:hypothetical protein